MRNNSQTKPAANTLLSFIHRHMNLPKTSAEVAPKRRFTSTDRLYILLIVKVNENLNFYILYYYSVKKHGIVM